MRGNYIHMLAVLAKWATFSITQVVIKCKKLLAAVSFTVMVVCTASSRLRNLHPFARGHLIREIVFSNNPFFADL
jgi:hypothetical protein